MSSPIMQVQLVLVLLLSLCDLMWGFEHCADAGSTRSSSAEQEFVCPTGNTCCQYGCIPNDLGSLNATCCNDDDDDEGRTGCGVGYSCAVANNTNDSILHSTYYCKAGSSISDPLVQSLPRYLLRQCSDQIRTVHGLPVVADDDDEFVAKNDSNMARLAYYSSHGDILALAAAAAAANSSTDNNTSSIMIRTAVIMVHGAGRNADDYFCALAAAATVEHKDDQTVLLIAPRFPVASDTDLNLEGGVAIRWRDNGSGPWRYGANAISPLAAKNVSSYDAMDRIVALLLDVSLFPNLNRLTIAGHSSGGQFVQRYALMTPLWDNERMRGVVANPSSYAYLTPLRRTNEMDWHTPINNNSQACPGYNQWEWGLDKGGNFSVPYVQAVLESKIGGDDALKERFRSRNLIYLAGSRDVCNVTGSVTGWCYSHGLETSCRDELQGANRWQRHNRYLASLDLDRIPYRRLIVPGVGHDHSLMFTSENGRKALFGDFEEPLSSITSN